MMRCRGFTLLELLVALSIMALVSVMAYGGLRTVLQTRSHVVQQAERMQQLQMALLIIGRDLQQVVGRSVRDEFGDTLPILHYAEFGTMQLAFTRSGWNNPASLPRSQLQRVGYGLEDGQWSRYAWQVLDRAQDSIPQQGVLLEGVGLLEWRFLDGMHEWREHWPVEATSPEMPSHVLPLAVELRIELDDLGTFRRLFVLPQVSRAKSDASMEGEK